MQSHEVKVYPAKTPLPRAEQLAWKIAAVASDHAAVDSAAGEMVINRIIDNAAVATAAINRTPVANARTQALAHPRANGATLFGIPAGQRFDCEWAAWANGVAVRELDMHDTFLAADYSHPGDNIPPLLAVAHSAAVQVQICCGEFWLLMRFKWISSVAFACMNLKKTTSRTFARPRLPALALCSISMPKRSISLSSRPYTLDFPRVNPARARFRAGRPMRPPMRASWR